MGTNRGEVEVMDIVVGGLASPLKTSPKLLLALLELVVELVSDRLP